MTENGYAVCLFAYDAKKVEDRGVVTVKLGKAEVVRLTNVRVRIPVTPDAIEEATKEYTFDVTDVDGETFKLRGTEAAAVAKYMHAMESVRGSIRTEAANLAEEDGMTVAEVSEALRPNYAEYITRFFNFVGFGGGRSGESRKLDAETVDNPDLTVEELRALVKAAGLVKKSKK